MEWMLQLVDEIDDAIGVVRHVSTGFLTDLGRLVAGVTAIPQNVRRPTAGSFLNDGRRELL